MKPTTPSTALAVPALCFAAFAWGSLFLVAKPMLAALDPLWFSCLRYLLATLALALLVQLRGRQPWQKLRRYALRLSGLGILGYAGFSFLVLTGLRHSEPSHGAILMATMPFTSLGLRWALDGQRPDGPSLLAASLALFGVSLVVGAGAASSGAILNAGDLLTLVGTLGWVVYARAAGRFKDLNSLEYTALSAVAAMPWTLAGALLASALHWVAWPSASLLLAQSGPLLYIALVPTVLAALAFNYGQVQVGPALASLFISLVPVSTLCALTLLGHHPSWREWLGAALVVAALALHGLKPHLSTKAACA